MGQRFVIPEGVNPDDQAFQDDPAGDTRTWREMVNEDIIIENLNSQWCIDNDIEGLGLVEEKVVAIPLPSDPVVEISDLLTLEDFRQFFTRGG